MFALIGFFVFALALATGLIAVGFFVVDFARNVGVWIIVAGAIAALGVVAALWTFATFRRRPRPASTSRPRMPPSSGHS